MRLETYKSNNKFEAEISDKLTSSDLSNFRELLSEIKQSTCKVIVLDLDNLEWIDSAGLGMLILAKELGEKEELELGRFEKIFNIQG